MPFPAGVSTLKERRRAYRSLRDAQRVLCRANKFSHGHVRVGALEMQEDTPPQKLNGTQQALSPRWKALVFADGSPTAFGLAISERVESPGN